MVADMEINGNKEIMTTAVETDSQGVPVSEEEAAIIAAETKEITVTTLDGRTITVAVIKEEEDIRVEVAVAVITEEGEEEEVNHTIEEDPHFITVMEEGEVVEEEVVVIMIAEAEAATELKKMPWDFMGTIAQTLKWNRSCSTLMKCRLRE